MKKRNAFLAAVLALCISVLLCACASSNQPAVQVGSDEVPTLYAAVGKRDITATNKGDENDTQYVTMTYKEGAVSEEDLLRYMVLLIDQSRFITTIDASTENGVLTMQLGKESATHGKTILVDIEHPEAGSTVIRYTAGFGTLTPSPAAGGPEPDATPEAEPTPAPDATAAPEAESEAESEAEAEATAAPDATTPAEVPATTGAADVSAALDATTTTDTNAAPLGSWVKTAMYATKDKTYHTVY
ncbi:MAG: hypothetical protein PHO10_11235, partial [Gemmiger sp.]|nr:hypothetical protein [Gemmiger sp.]